MEVKEPSPKYLIQARTHQTEAGRLPLDWSAAALSDLLSSRQLGGNYRNGAAETAWPLIKMGNLGRGRIDCTKVEYIHDPVPPSARDRLRTGDVLFNTRNTLELVGKVAIWRDELPEAHFNSNIMRMGFDVDRVGSNAYMNYVLNTARSISALRSIATGTTSVAAIYGRDFRNVYLPLPSSKREQRDIAEALTDIDAFIDSLEHLLTKKRHIKQGAMQELLTGKRRLPGFPSSWSEVRLGEVGRTYGGLTGKGKADFGHGASKYITFMNVMTTVRTSTEMVESVQVGPSELQNVVQPGDLLFNGSSETPEEVALCSWVESCDEGVFLNSFCFGFRPFASDRLSGLFMAYFFRGRPGRAAVSSLAQGATRYNIAKTALLQVPLCLPSLAEQHAIAEVLSSMDTDIAALEYRLTKARALKQAMAQALLTGRIRLVEPSA